MGTVELWLGAAGCGKTGGALRVLREELARGWAGVRYLVPTVGHKQSIEHLLISGTAAHGLIGDPLTTFFNFAEEVAAQARLQGQRLSELQKYLLLKTLARDTPLTYFANARRFPGFVPALGEAIDELKVAMVMPDALLSAAERAQTRGAAEFAEKVGELGQLYANYQQLVHRENLYDSEGIMWLAAEALRHDASLCADLRCLVLDGFARLTPIQVEFLSALAPRLERVIVLFDYEEGRTLCYHPVEHSLEALEREARHGHFMLRRVPCERISSPKHTLDGLRTELFRERRHILPIDDSLHLFAAATPAHEAELIARAIRTLLRDGLPGGEPVAPGDIAILARNADAVRERLERTCARFGVAVQRPGPALAHTPVGRALLATLRLVRNNWPREDLLSLLKSGLLPMEPGLAFRIDLTARTRYLREGRDTWLYDWPDEATAEPLRTALAPILAFDDASRVAAGMLDALGALLDAFATHALPETPPLPDVQPHEAARYAALTAELAQARAVLTDLRGLERLLGAFTREEVVELITTALLRAELPTAERHGVAIQSAHTTGGQKFKVVFLCHLLQGVFPRHLRESAFLLDHERSESLHELGVDIDPRKHLEDDERFWFLHALASATHQIVLCYPRHTADGAPLERSYFLDEVEKVVPDLHVDAKTTSPFVTLTEFSDVAPPLHRAEHRHEWLAQLAVGMRTERSEAGQATLAAAYLANLAVYGPNLAELFRRARTPEPALGSKAQAQLARRTRPFSASELQAYLDCPFLWFGQSCLALQSISEEFSPLDRGAIVHEVLQALYRRHQERPRVPVHLEHYSLDALWPEVEADLKARLAANQLFANRSTFWREIETESLLRALKRFLRLELERAATRGVHPAYFERHFGSTGHEPLTLCDGAIRLRGTIDRIDLADDDPEQAVVIDYKASASMSLRDLESGKVLQAPIYALALARLTGFTPLGVEFLGIAQGEGKGVFCSTIGDRYPKGRGMKTLVPDAWQDLLDTCETRLGEAVRRMVAGEIPLAPTTNLCPDRCSFFALCRGNRTALEALVRAAKE